MARKPIYRTDPRDGKKYRWITQADLLGTTGFPAARTGYWSLIDSNPRTFSSYHGRGEGLSGLSGLSDTPGVTAGDWVHYSAAVSVTPYGMSSWLGIINPILGLKIPGDVINQQIQAIISSLAPALTNAIIQPVSLFTFGYSTPLVIDAQSGMDRNSIEDIRGDIDTSINQTKAISVVSSNIQLTSSPAVPAAALPGSSPGILDSISQGISNAFGGLTPGGSSGTFTTLLLVAGAVGIYLVVTRK